MENKVGCSTHLDCIIYVWVNTIHLNDSVKIFNHDNNKLNISQGQFLALRYPSAFNNSAVNIEPPAAPRKVL